MQSSLMDSPTRRCWGFRLQKVEITPSILALLLQFLNQPLPPRVDIGRELKFNYADFDHCRILQPMTSHPTFDNDERSFCTSNVIYDFLGTLASRSSILGLYQSPDMLPFLFSGPTTIDMQFLVIDQVELSAMECAGLSDWVQRNVQLTDILINTSYLEAPQDLGQGLAKALHLKRLVLERKLKDTYQLCHRELVDGLLGKDGNGNTITAGMVGPQSRLQELCLSQMHLKDHHFLTIVQMLPTSQIKNLDVSNNEIQWQAIMTFARQLSKIKRLKEVALDGNPWEDAQEGPAASHYDMCCTALMDGMLENFSINCLWISCGTLAGDMVRSCCRTNGYREQILATFKSIPVGVWPFILERIGILPCQCHPRWARQSRFRKYRANALYSVLKNSRILSSICDASSLID